MKTLILNANPAPGSAELNDYLNKLEQKLQTSGEVEICNLAEANIHFCTGCWSCWLKTPGRCVFRDEMDRILPKIIAADVLIFATPLVMGFIHSSLKKAMDRSIPLLLPYIGIYHGECHHYLRYSKSPALALLVEKEPDTDEEDLEIVTHTFQRLSLNFRNRLLWVKTTEVDVAKVFEEVMHEINHI